MTVLVATGAVRHDLHGVHFDALVNSSTGSRELCAWRVELPPGTVGLPHTLTCEEVVLVLAGAVDAMVDGRRETAGTGDAVVLPAGVPVALENPSDLPAVAWVTTSRGLQAVLADGSRLSPPWAQ